MLAGRKLLLADDSITIQKVIELTFADEGVEVLSVSDGQEAIERVEHIAPDIVLADVFMPRRSGYEVCEYIKQNAKLNHIPVMLLVGSFEPFDEVEARRVGANDILTKPFQSIRRLMDKVSELISGKPALTEVPTAELPRAEEPNVVQKLSTAELEVTTADTRPLAIEEPSKNHQAAPSAELPQARQDATVETWENKNMESTISESQHESYRETGDMLLDLGDIAAASFASAEDFVLDIDLDEDIETPVVATGSSFRSQAIAEHRFSQANVGGWGVQSEKPSVGSTGRFGESQHRNGDTVEPSILNTSSSSMEGQRGDQEWIHQEAKPVSRPISNEAEPEVVAAQTERVWDHAREAVGNVMPAGQITSRSVVARSDRGHRAPRCGAAFRKSCAGDCLGSRPTARRAINPAQA